jgi:hypothetical protein
VAGGLEPLELLTVWEQGSAETPLQRALTLVASVRAQPRAEAAELDVGTRDVLLARYLISGGVAWVATCATCPKCSVRLEVPMDLGELAVLPVHEPGTTFTIMVDDVSLTFRLPTTADLLGLSGLAEGEGRGRLLDRCVDGPPAGLTERMAAAVEAAMEQAAPAGAVDIVVSCPECGAEELFALDVSELLWADVEARAVRLVGEIHALARAYGWTEAEILALSPRRRASYLALVEA